VPLGRVRINWEAAYARDYELQLSNDGVAWTSARQVRDSQGGVEEHALDGSARFVRLYGTRRATGYGYSMWELQVFDASGRLVSEGKPVRASSLEAQNAFALWARFWPLLLVASGLPLFLAPRDDTSQVVGIVLAGLGGFIQLKLLGAIPWGVREGASVVLVVVGLVILFQSLRRSEPPSGGATPGMP
jgi:hypothetical protein